MIVRARLWGFQGSFGGNEDVLAQALPLLTFEGDEGVWIPVEPSWRGPGDGLLRTANPDECGTSLIDAQSSLVKSGELVFLMGPEFDRRCKSLEIPISLVPLATVASFA